MKKDEIFPSSPYVSGHPWQRRKPAPLLLRIFVGSIGLVIASCGEKRDAQSDTPEPAGSAEYPAIKKLTDEEITEQVRKSLFETLGKLTRHRTRSDVHIAYLSFGQDNFEAKKAIAEFTIHPDRFKIRYSREAPSQYEQENGIDRVTVDRIEGFTIRVMLDQNYPVLHPWSAAELATESLGWKWEIKSSMEEGTKVQEIRGPTLKPFPVGRMVTLYPPEEEPNKWTGAALEQFNLAVGRYFKATTNDKGTQSIIWARKTYANNHNVFQCRGQIATLWENMDVDEEGRQAGVKQRGLLEYVIGTQFRHTYSGNSTDDYSGKWSPWWAGMMVIRCYYQVDSSESIQWVASINKEGETRIPEEGALGATPLFGRIETKRVGAPEKVWRILFCELDASEYLRLADWMYDEPKPEDHRPRDSAIASRALMSCAVDGVSDFDNWQPGGSSPKLRGWRLALAAEKGPGPSAYFFSSAPDSLGVEVTMNIPGETKAVNPGESLTVKAVLDSCKAK